MSERPLITRLLDAPTIQAAIKDALVYPSRTAALERQELQAHNLVLQKEVVALKEQTYRLQHKIEQLEQSKGLPPTQNLTSIAAHHHTFHNTMQTVRMNIATLKNQLNDMELQKHQQRLDQIYIATSLQDAHDKAIQAVTYCDEINEHDIILSLYRIANKLHNLL